MVSTDELLSLGANLAIIGGTLYILDKATNQWKPVKKLKKDWW